MANQRPLLSPGQGSTGEGSKIENRKSKIPHSGDSLAVEVGRLLLARGLTLALAESCTGGLIGSLLFSTEFGARAIFALSSGLRIAVVLLLIRFLLHSTPVVRRTRPLFRITGFRPGAGVSQRPIEESEAFVAPPID